MVISYVYYLLAMDVGGYFLCILFTSHGRGWLFLMYIIYWPWTRVVISYVYYLLAMDEGGYFLCILFTSHG